MIILTILAIFALIALIGGAITAIKAKSEGLEIISAIICMIGLIAVIIMFFAFWDYMAAGYKKEIINTEFQTNYTQDQIYFAEDVIDEIREIQRQRIELNGNLFSK